MKNSDEYFMSIALKEALKGRGFVKTNPLVGAVIVKDKKIISKGFHAKFGAAHAEINAIKNTKENINGTELYVTLEPCSTYGKTPPCTEAIIQNKFKRVIIGTVDPNPKHNGKAVEILSKYNIEVKTGVLEDECKKLIKPFCVNQMKNRPYITLKLAMTLDGKIASSTGDSKWITNEKSRKIVHKMRKSSDAVMIGKNTAFKDNPELTVRNINTARHPDRIVFDSNLELPKTLKLFDINCNERVFVVYNENGVLDFKVEDNDNVTQASLLEGIKDQDKDNKRRIIYINSNNGLNSVLTELYNNYEIGTILLEGGSNLAASFLKKKLVDRIMFFYSPKIIGGDGLSGINSLNINLIKDSLMISNIEYTVLSGGDFLVEGDLR